MVLCPGENRLTLLQCLGDWSCSVDFYHGLWEGLETRNSGSEPRTVAFPYRVVSARMASQVKNPGEAVCDPASPQKLS